MSTSIFQDHIPEDRPCRWQALLKGHLSAIALANSKGKTGLPDRTC